MEPVLNDPNNHVPEVTPNDEWGDAETLSASFPGAATVLPPKRVRSESSRPEPGEGLRIAPGLPVREDIEELPTFEVREIDGSVVRLDPEPPSAARVPRLQSFQERPAREPEARSIDKHWGRGASQSTRWILGTGLGVAALVILSLMLLPLINQSNAERPLPNLHAGPEETQEDLEASRKLNDMVERQSEAEQVFRIFARSTMAEDSLPILRQPEVVGPIIRSTPPIPMVTKDWIPGEDVEWSVFKVGDSSYGVLSGSLPDFRKFRAYLALEGDFLRLDWKATTAYGTATFDELANQKGDPSEIRAFIEPASFYTMLFPESEYQSYQLVAPDGEQTLWCYTPRNTKVDAEIGRMFTSNGVLDPSFDPQRVTIRLTHGPEGRLPNQWQVAELLHKDWLAPQT